MIMMFLAALIFQMIELCLQGDNYNRTDNSNEATEAIKSLQQYALLRHNLHNEVCYM